METCTENRQKRTRQAPLSGEGPLPSFPGEGGPWEDGLRPVPRIPPVNDASWTEGNRHIQEWISACKTGTQPCANFQQSAPLTEMVLLGNVALLSGKPIEWDSQKLEVTNLPEANRFVRGEYRKGWRL